LKVFSCATLGFALVSCGLFLPARPAQASGGQISIHFGWDTPPNEFREFQRRGFHDGLDAAHRDFEHHMRPDVNQHPEFHNPPVPPEFARDYQDGFRHGYDNAVRHFFADNQPPEPQYQQPAPRYQQPVAPPPPPMSSGWNGFPHNAPPPARAGYVDGILGGAYDVAAGGPPRLESHDEFRRPHVPFLARESYRNGYRTGYETAFRNYSNPGDQMRRRGFVEGIAAARRDRDQNFPPNENAHEELRHPPVPPPAHEDYRDGFHHGYEMASSYIF